MGLELLPLCAQDASGQVWPLAQEPVCPMSGRPEACRHVSISVPMAMPWAGQLGSLLLSRVSFPLPTAIHCAGLRLPRDAWGLQRTGQAGAPLYSPECGSPTFPSLFSSRPCHPSPYPWVSGTWLGPA